MAEHVLIMNADDFGQSHEVNAAVLETHTAGILTSASLMVRQEAAAEAAQIGRRYRDTLSVGLHLELGEWASWNAQPFYEIIPGLLDGHGSDADIRCEIQAQLALFRELMGCAPTHIDSHQHVHQSVPQVRSIAQQIASQLGVPLRHFAPDVQYSGAFWGQGMSYNALVRILKRLPPGITEIGCHPSKGVTPHDREIGYHNERVNEYQVLSNPWARPTVERMGIALRPFHQRHDVQARMSRPAARAGYG
jgi:predicted glycoside hydrolase/deacetylase ChbG (UPF0249 family)